MFTTERPQEGARGAQVQETLKAYCNTPCKMLVCVLTVHTLVWITLRNADDAAFRLKANDQQLVGSCVTVMSFYS